MGVVVASQTTDSILLASGLASTSYKQLRQMTQAFGASGGVMGFADMKVATGGGMSVNVPAGYCWVKGSFDVTATGQFLYGVPLTTTKNLAGITAPTGATRRDMVVCRAYDSVDDPGYGGLNLGRVEYIKNAAETLVAETPPADCFVLAYVDVTVGAASITAGMITDRRYTVAAPGRELLSPTTPSSGYAQITANFAAAGDAITLTLNGDGVTPVLLEGWSRALSSTSAPPVTIIVELRDAAGGAGTLLCDTALTGPNIAGTSVPCNIKARIAAFSGLKTVYMRITATAGTPTLYAQATSPAFIRATWAG